MTSCFHLKLQDVNFMSDVYEKFKFKAGIVVVDDTIDLDHHIKETLLKSDQQMFRIMTANQVEKIVESASKGQEYRGCFLFLKDTSEFLRKVDQLNRKAFKITTWFIVLRNESEDSRPDLGLQFRYDSNVFMVKNTGVNKIDIVEVYSIDKRVFHVNTGQWTEENSLEWSLLGKWERRRDMGGVNLRSLYLLETGYLELQDGLAIDPRNLAILPWVGIFPDVYQSLAATFNFTYTLAQPRDGKWGTKEESGEWSGIIKDLIDEVADLSICSLILSEARAKVVDFALPFSSDFTQFFVSKQTSSYSVDIYTKPFNSNTWIVLFIIIIGTSFIFSAVTKQGKEKFYPEFSLRKCCVYVYGAFGGFAARRWSVTPVNISARYELISEK